MENLIKIVKGRFPPNSSKVLWLNAKNNRLYHCDEGGWTPLNDENIRIDDLSDDVGSLTVNVNTISGSVTTLSGDVITISNSLKTLEEQVKEMEGVVIEAMTDTDIDSVCQ